MDAPHRAAADTPGAGIVDIAMKGYERRTRSRYPFYKLQESLLANESFNTALTTP